MLFQKNVRSTVNLEGWEKIPEIWKAEDATIHNAVSIELERSRD